MNRNTPNSSRRRFLSFLGVAGASATASAVAIMQPKPQEESQAPFDHPAEYLAAMQAIGWRPVAMYQRCADGSIRQMGVAEHARDRAAIHETLPKFHAIQMRAPVRRPADMPQNDWWKRVWSHLYDQGMREDVMLARSEGENA